MNVKVKNNINYIQVVVIISGLVILLFIIGRFSVIQAEVNNSEKIALYSTNSNPYGFTFAEWTAKWLQWALSIPKENNPANDDSGKNCALDQKGPVWFLAGTFGGSATRNCTIPAGKAILFPILNAECSYSEYPKLKTDSDLRSCAKASADPIGDMAVNIDGINLENLQKYRVQSPLFNITFPASNAYGIKAGTTQSVADGYWIFLNPVPAGNHKIHFKGAIIDYTSTAIVNFSIDVTYNLTVQ